MLAHKGKNAFFTLINKKYPNVNDICSNQMHAMHRNQGSSKNQ